MRLVRSFSLPFLLLLAVAACGDGDTTGSAETPEAPATSISSSTTTVPRTAMSTSTTVTTATLPNPTILPFTEESDADAYFSLLGENPTAFPTDWSVGFIYLDSALSEVEAVFGPAGRIHRNMFFEHVWDLPGQAVLQVGTYEADGETSGVAHVSVEIPDGSPVRFAMHGGVVLGIATLGDLTGAWGDPVMCADIDKADCDLFYERCLGSGMVVCPLLLFVDIEESPGIGIDHSSRIRSVSLGDDQYPGAWEMCRDLELSSSGLGLVAFGDDESEAMAALTRTLGPSAKDAVSEWDEPVGIHDGYPAGRQFRQVTWEDLGITAVFSDGIVWPDGRDGSRLIAWSYYGTPNAPFVLDAGNGIELGSTGAELLSAYGEALTINAPDDYFGWRVSLPGANPDTNPPVLGLTFLLDGGPDDSASVVVGMAAGAAQAP